MGNECGLTPARPDVQPAGPAGLNGRFQRSIHLQQIIRRTTMAIKINDLHVNQALDREAMSAIKGGGAPWVYGWISPFVAERSFGAGSNFFQITNNYYADQMNNQIQVVDVKNTAPNSNITVGLDQLGNNFKH
jgi:hypothetical protein